MGNKRGSALLLAIMMVSVLLTLAVILSKIVYNGYATSVYLLRREQAFWLAEAGLEAGKVELNRNPGWYTDLPRYPENDTRWIKLEAIGLRQNLGEGSYKLVREKDRDRFYAAGFKGKAVVVLKIKFAQPFKILSWEEL